MHVLERQLYIKLVSSLLIPILGFLWWDWSLYFIFLYYFLELFSNEIVVRLKSKKILGNGEERQFPFPTKTYAIVSGIFYLLIVAFIHLGMALYQPEINFSKEIWEFLAYKELGIPQGIILLPLIAMMTYSSYKVEFIMPRLYLRINENALWKQHVKGHFVLLAFAMILTLLATHFQLKEVLVLSIVLIATTLYNYLQGKEEIKILLGKN